MDKNTLKSYFQTGKIPTQANFEALIDYIPYGGVIPIITKESDIGTLEGIAYINSQITIQNEIFIDKTIHLIGITPNAKLEFDSGMIRGNSQLNDIIFENLAIDSNIDICSFKRITLKNCTINKIAGTNGFYNCINVYIEDCRILTESAFITTRDGVVSIINSYIESSDATGSGTLISPNTSNLSIIGCELVIHNFTLVAAGTSKVKQTLVVSNSRILIDHSNGMIFNDANRAESVLIGCSIDITSTKGNIAIKAHKMIGNNIINRSADAAVLTSALAIANTCINNGGGFNSTNFMFLNNSGTKYNQI